MLGYEVTHTGYDITVNGTHSLHIAEPCNGLDFFGLFICFILAFPTTIKEKLKFLPIGLLTIHVLNMIRINLLIFNYYHFRTSFDFNHKVTFNLIVYGIMLVMWVLWTRKQIQKGGISTTK